MDHQYLPRHSYPSVDADPAPNGSTIIAELPGRGRDNRNLPDWTASMADLNIYNGLFRAVDMSHRNPVPASALPATGPMPIHGNSAWDPARVSPVRLHRGRHARRHRWLRRLGLAAVLAILLGAIAWAGLGGPLPSNPFAPHGGTPTVSAPGSGHPSHAESASAVHVVRTAYRVIFRVTGSGQADNISYGSESQLISKPDITAVPFTASLPWDANVKAYTITAQQYGADGYVQSTITIRQIDHLSDGTRKVKNTTVAVGNANTDGSYATARYAK